MMAEKTPKKTRVSAGYHHGDLRTALVEAATDIVETEGVMALSLRGVARAAGVSQTAPYHHFADKEALLAAVAETGFRGLSQAMVSHIQGIDDAGDQLVALGHAYVSFATENPGRFRLMFGPHIPDKTAYPDLVASGAKSYDMIKAAVQARRLELDTHQGTLEADTMAAWSIVHGLATLLIDSGFNEESMGAPTQKVLVEHVTQALVGGLGRGEM